MPTTTAALRDIELLFDHIIVICSLYPAAAQDVADIGQLKKRFACTAWDEIFRTNHFVQNSF